MRDWTVEDLTRETARAAFRSVFPSGEAAKGFSESQMIDLRNAINKRLLEAAPMCGTLHMQHPSHVKVSGWGCRLYCDSYYFEGREAVTIEASGFAGFAGWADDNNVRPFLLGFMDWLECAAMIAAEKG